jgi:site-specific DNA-methyltransferase (adenine-specific)
MTFIVHHGDCREVMATLDAESVDAVVCDPPYGLSFMGKGWDHGVPGEEFWTKALRVAKPGAHLLAFGGTRTYHRLACAIEDAGWEIRDCVMWVYGSGFPKSHDVSKAIDKAAGAKREVMGVIPDRWTGKSSVLNFATDRPQSEVSVTGAPATDAARQWSGWGTALKPAWEPIIVARKPLCGTVAENVLTHGTGGINVDGCRVKTDDSLNGGAYAKNGTERTDEWGASNGFRRNQALEYVQPSGRWPANLIHDGSEEVVGLFPVTKTGVCPADGAGGYEGGLRRRDNRSAMNGGDSGSAARFFYCAKASKADRDEGCEGLAERLTMRYGEKAQGPLPQQTPSKPVPQRNHHPTVKPTALMRYLCRLVTPPGGVVLDPFTGSGSTGKAAVCEGFDFVGIEREAEYVEIARARIAAAVLPWEATA